MKVNNLSGFEIMDVEEQSNISAGSFLGIVKTVGPLMFGGITGIITSIGNIFNVINRKKVIDHAASSVKGEIEINKDSTIKTKWDNSTIPNFPSVIF